MKIGDLVKTVNTIAVQIPFSGIVIEITDPKDHQETSRAIVMTNDGGLRTMRMSYNLLEQVKEA